MSSNTVTTATTSSTAPTTAEQQLSAFMAEHTDLNRDAAITAMMIADTTISADVGAALRSYAAPIVQPPVKASKPQKEKKNVMSTKKPAPIVQKPINAEVRDKAIAERRARQTAAINASNTLSTHQKTAAHSLIARDADGAIHPAVKVSDGTIAKFQSLIESRDPMAMALVPANYNVKPAWLGQKDFDKAKKQFNRDYDALGLAGFDRDDDGRLIMELPMTTGRFVACVLAGDVSNVLRFAGAMKPSEDGTFYWLSRLDVTAPIIASVYRAGATFNRASKAYDKALVAADAADADKAIAAGKRRDAKRTAMLDARVLFVQAYMAVFADADTVKGLSDRADGLVLAAQQALLAEQAKRDAASESVKGNAGTINTATAGK